MATLRWTSKPSRLSKTVQYIITAERVPILDMIGCDRGAEGMEFKAIRYPSRDPRLGWHMYGYGLDFWDRTSLQWRLMEEREELGISLLAYWICAWNRTGYQQDRKNNRWLWFWLAWFRWRGFYAYDVFLGGVFSCFLFLFLCFELMTIDDWWWIYPEEGKNFALCIGEGEGGGGSLKFFSWWLIGGGGSLDLKIIYLPR